MSTNEAIANEYKQPLEPISAAELVDYVVMEIECAPQHSYEEAINEVFNTLRPAPEQGEQALAWFAGACMEGMQPTQPGGAIYGWDEFQAAVAEGVPVPVRRAITLADKHFHNNALLANGRVRRLEIARAARVALRHCESCGEHFEGRERIANAALAAHSCTGREEASDGATAT